MLLGCVNAASHKRFSDVSEKHWAAPYINALADGGLVNGYNGKFAPSAKLTIDQMCTLICNAKGYPQGSQNGYWAYDAVEYCRDELYCLPNFGEINENNYGVPCTRELAVYMATKALGVGPNTTKNPNITAENIPDFGEISMEYATTILQAYRLGLTNGCDAKGTFAPKSYLTRDQVCTLLYRAGFTKAAETPDDTVAPGMAGADIYSTVKSRWNNVWRTPELKNGDAKYVMAKDPIYGNLEVYLLPSGAIQITMPEKGTQIINGKWADRYGNELTQEQLKNGKKDENGKVLASSAWHYEPRQLVKEILALAYPESTDEAYSAMLSVMKQEIYELPSDYLPSSIRWIDGRMFLVTLDNSAKSLHIIIGNPGDKGNYNDHMADPSIGNQAKYVSYYGGADPAISYELDKG